MLRTINDIEINSSSTSTANTEVIEIEQLNLSQHNKDEDLSINANATQPNTLAASLDAYFLNTKRHTKEFLNQTEILKQNWTPWVYTSEPTQVNTIKPKHKTASKIAGVLNKYAGKLTSLIFNTVTTPFTGPAIAYYELKRDFFSLKTKLNKNGIEVPVVETNRDLMIVDLLLGGPIYYANIVALYPLYAAIESTEGVVAAAKSPAGGIKESRLRLHSGLMSQCRLFLNRESGDLARNRFDSYEKKPKKYSNYSFFVTQVATLTQNIPVLNNGLYEEQEHPASFEVKERILFAYEVLKNYLTVLQANRFVFSKIIPEGLLQDILILITINLLDCTIGKEKFAMEAIQNWSTYTSNNQDNIKRKNAIKGLESLPVESFTQAAMRIGNSR